MGLIGSSIMMLMSFGCSPIDMRHPFLDSVAPGIAGLFVQRFNAVLPESGRRRDGLAHPS